MLERTLKGFIETKPPPSYFKHLSFKTRKKLLIVKLGLGIDGVIKKGTAKFSIDGVKGKYTGEINANEEAHGDGIFRDKEG